MKHKHCPRVCSAVGCHASRNRLAANSSGENADERRGEPIDDAADLPRVECSRKALVRNKQGQRCSEKGGGNADPVYPSLLA